jgi:predicted outer membrane repeat protein
MLGIRSGTADGTSENGGGIFLQPFTSLELYGVDVSDNVAYLNGGGIYSDLASVFMFICSVRDNQAANHGGGAYVDSASLFIIGVTFENNSTDISDGGGLMVVGGSNASIYSSLFKDNTAALIGGGINNSSDGSMQIYDSGFINNTALDGAAIKSTGAISLERAFVTGNVSAIGSTLTFGNSNFNLTDVTIANNTAAGVAAILFAGDGYTGTLDHVTVVGNQSTGSYAAIMVFAGSIVLMNSIIDNTGSGDGSDACDFNYPISNVISADYNIASDASCNLTQAHDHPSTDPQLNVPGYYGGMFIAEPLAGSIAIDSANPSFLPGDIDQRSAIREDGDLNGSVLPDIGAAEFLLQKVFIPLAVKP